MEKLEFEKKCDIASFIILSLRIEIKSLLEFAC